MAAKEIKQRELVILTQLDFNFTPLVHSEPVSVSPSQTIPDDTFTVSELLQRHASGLSLGGRSDAYFEQGMDENDFDSLDINDRKNFDLTDIDEAKRVIEETEKASKGAKRQAKRQTKATDQASSVDDQEALADE